MGWIEDADRIDRALAGAGVPDAIRMKAMGEIMTVLCQFDKQRRRENRRAEVRAMVRTCGGKVEAAAARLGITPRAVYYHLEQIEVTRLGHFTKQAEPEITETG